MAKFIMRPLNTAAQGEEKKLYPHLVKTGNATLDELARKISASSTFTAGDMKGVVAALAREIAWAAAQGSTVKIDGLGSFRATLGLKGDSEAELADSTTRRNAASIKFNGLNFRPSRDLLAEINKHGHLERLMPGKTDGKADRLTPEQRIERARQFLTEHPWMRVKDYADMCHLSNTTASKELHILAGKEDSFLDTAGRGSHKVYILRRNG